MADLPTNLKDDILDSNVNTKRKYNMIENEDGTYSFEDVTEYSQVGDEYGAGLINETNKQVNAKVEKAVVVRDLETIGAITQPGFIPDALAVKDVNDSLGGTQFQVIDGQIQWKETGADTWNFFSSNTSDVTFGMVYQYGTGDHISDIYSYNDNSVSISDNVITFKRSGTINVKYGVHCDNGKDFVGYCLNGVQTDFGNSLGMYEMELEISKGDTLYFLSSNTTTNRRTTLFGFVNFV